MFAVNFQLNMQTIMKKHCLENCFFHSEIQFEWIQGYFRTTLIFWYNCEIKLAISLKTKASILISNLCWELCSDFKFVHFVWISIIFCFQENFYQTLTVFSVLQNCWFEICEEIFLLNIYLEIYTITIDCFLFYLSLQSSILIMVVYMQIVVKSAIIC